MEIDRYGLAVLDASISSGTTLHRLAPSMSMRLAAGALIVVTSACGPSASERRAPTTSASTPAVAITGVTVITMTSPGSVLLDQAVVVRRGLIERIVPARSLEPAVDVQVVDASGMFLLPGLVDVHAHLEPDAPEINEDVLRMFVANGVTTAVVLNGHPAAVQLRDGIAAGRVTGPRLIVSSPPANDPAMSAADAAAFVARSREQGYDAIKVYEGISAEGFFGVMRAARAIGMLVVGHVPKRVGVRAALGAGMVRIAHAEELLYAEPLHFRAGQTDPAVLTESAIDQILDPVADAHAAFSSTLVAFERIARAAADHRRLLRDTAGNVPPPGRAPGWRRMVDDGIYARRFSSEFARSQIAAALDYLSRLTRRASERGILIGAGTDAPFYGYMTAGESLVEEVVRLHDAGLTAYGAVAAATSDAARYARKEREFGTIEVGRSADLLLLASDPLRDPSALRHLRGVMKRGEWCDAPCLATLRVAAAN